MPTSGRSWPGSTSVQGVNGIDVGFFGLTGGMDSISAGDIVETEATGPDRF